MWSRTPIYSGKCSSWRGDIGTLKVNALAARLCALDASLDIRAMGASFDGVGEADVVLDGTDNFETRFAVNAACIAADVPLVSGAVAGWAAQVGVFRGRDGVACYRCFVPECPPDAETCEAVGIIGAIAGLAGSVMALEALKLITGAGEPFSGRLWLHDGLAGRSRVISVSRDAACAACSGNHSG